MLENLNIDFSLYDKDTPQCINEIMIWEGKKHAYSWSMCVCTRNNSIKKFLLVVSCPPAAASPTHSLDIINSVTQILLFYMYLLDKKRNSTL